MTVNRPISNPVATKTKMDPKELFDSGLISALREGILITGPLEPRGGPGTGPVHRGFARRFKIFLTGRPRSPCTDTQTLLLTPQHVNRKQTLVEGSPRGK